MTADAGKRIRLAQAILIATAAVVCVAFVVVLTNRRQAALLLETRVAVATAHELIDRQQREAGAAAQRPRLEPAMLLRLHRQLRDYHFAVYSGNHLHAVMPVDFAAADVLPAEIWRDIAEREDIWSGVLPIAGEEFGVAVAPLKDAEQWAVAGALLIAQRADRYGWRYTVGSLPGLAALVCAISLVATGFVMGRSAGHHSSLKTWRWLSLLLLLVSWAGVALWSLRQTVLLHRGRAVALVALQDSLPEAASRRTTLFAFAEIAQWGAFALVVIFAALLIAVALLRYVTRYAAEPRRLSQTLTGYAFLAPSFLHLLVFSLGPILFAFVISFHAWSILVPERPFIGLANYLELLRDQDFWRSLRNTALYTLHVPFAMAVSLALALLMNQKLRGVHFLRTIFFLPSVTSFVAIAIVWQWIYNPDFGLLNYALHLIGLGPFPWLNDPRTALLSLMFMAVWIQAGYQMVIYLAGLQSIPQFLYDAATVDGASRWEQFWRITFPMLQPTSFFILVTSLIGSFQVFTQVYVMTEGGPLKATEVMVYHIYKNAWDYLRMGYASAMSFVLFVVVMLLTLVQFRLMGKRQEWW